VADPGVRPFLVSPHLLTVVAERVTERGAGSDRRPGRGARSGRFDALARGGGPRAAGDWGPAHWLRGAPRPERNRDSDTVDAAFRHGVLRVGRGRLRAGQPGVAGARDRASGGS